MKPHRILIATDVPFWRQSTGAEQRISSLVRYLMGESFLVRIFFLGQIAPEDQTLITMQSLDVEKKTSDQPPKNFVKKIGWYADATFNQLQQRLTSPGGSDDAKEASKALKLEEFCWPWAVTAFEESVSDFNPDSILIEYVKLVYLLEGLSSKQRGAVNCLIDTHDILHLRCQQFRERGYCHWIDIDREEESKALSKFDTVIAIQEEEAKLISEMIADRNPNSKVIVCGHAPEVPSVAKTVNEFHARNEAVISIGYLASTNASNAMSIEWFLNEVWQPLSKCPSEHSKGAGKVQLKIGGTICQTLELLIAANPMGNVELLGHVENLQAFYDSVGLIINPVKFGTGLKIKTVEAIGFGKPVLSTLQGVVGLEQSNLVGDSPAVKICETAEEFRSELLFLANNTEQLNKRTDAAQQLGQSLFSDQQVYSSLKQCLVNDKYS